MSSSGYRDNVRCARSCGNQTAWRRGYSSGAWLSRLRAAGVAAAVAVLCILGTGAAQPAQAQVESVIHSFSGANGTGKYLYGGLLRDSNTGNLFGTTYEGGSYGVGTVFEEVYDPATHSYTEQSLLSFDGSDGANPWSGLIMDSSGNLYGTTYSGGTIGDGTVFELSPPATSGNPWTVQVLYSFSGSDGANPEAGLIMDSSGNLYGTTVNGGSGLDGTVFKLSPPATAGNPWTEDVLHSFTGYNSATPASSDGANPEAGLVMDSSGNLYGTTSNGGSGLDGTVFKLSPPATSGNPWTEQVLYSFTGYNSATPASSDGANPEAGLVMDSSGNLYGTTYNGGSNDYGAVFKLSPPAVSGNPYAEQVLYSFNYLDGSQPYSGLVMGPQGNLYGTTVYGGSYSDGVVFELTQASGYTTENVLLNFASASGGYPRAGLMMDSAGNLYGTTYSGGPDFAGTVFELTQASGYQTEQVLHNFTGPDGKWPHAGLVRDSAGNLYGTTYIGGPAGEGSVYGIAPLTVSPSTLDFGAVGTGVTSAPQTVTVTNNGSGSLSFGTATISGANAGDFSIGPTDTCSGQTVAAQSSCSVSVTYTPSTSTAETASLNVVESGLTQAVGLSGTGVSVTASISPSSLTFSDTIAGTTSNTQPVTLTNTSASSTLTIDSISASANFTETNDCGASLAAGSACTINVAFSPAATGSLKGTLTVTDNTSSGSQTVSLSGTGVTAAGYIQDVMVPQVESLGLNNGQTNSLVKDLTQAAQMITAGKINGAIGNLDQFIAEVNDLYSSGKLSQQDATTLVSEANYVINSLQ